MLKRVEGLSWPSRGTLTSRFGWRYRRHHNGIDLAAPWGTPIQAARDGIVVFAGWYSGYGKVVFIAHGDGVVTVYGHASKLLVKVGDQITQGQVIANVGCTGVCTGSHLHFEVRIDGQPVDPLKFL
jgi:murein DD-endopeptidase MepM/ murein hydrolase activator NlpD